TLDIKPEGTDWTVSPGIFFAYEPIYVSRGLDLTVSGELFNGDFIPSFSYGVRYDTITGGNLEVAGIFNSGGRHDISPDGVDRRYHSRFSHNLQLGFTQILSPEWRINAGLQYTRQDGFLSYPNAKVVV